MLRLVRDSETDMTSGAKNENGWGGVSGESCFGWVQRVSDAVGKISSLLVILTTGLGQIDDRKIRATNEERVLPRLQHRGSIQTTALPFGCSGRDRDLAVRNK